MELDDDRLKLVRSALMDECNSYLIVLDTFEIHWINRIDRPFESTANAGRLTDHFRKVVYIIEIELFASAVLIGQIRCGLAVRHH